MSTHASLASVLRAWHLGDLPKILQNTHACGCRSFYPLLVLKVRVGLECGGTEVTQSLPLGTGNYSLVISDVT